VRLALVGIGAVGARVARQLAVTDAVAELSVHHPDPASSARLAGSLGPKVTSCERVQPEQVDAVVLAGPPGTHTGLARRTLAAGRPVISVSDSMGDVRSLLALDAVARERNVSLVVGAGFAPGLTGVVAKHASRDLDRVCEVHVAKFGTGGPACARQHHHALGARAVEWRDGRWIPRSGGAGRHLSWFPEPVGGADCYYAALPEPLFLRQLFPEASRLTARMAATRRDRFTSRLPMLRRPHPEGTVGAIRVEVRGELDGERVVRVFGASAAPAVAAAAVAACAAVVAAKGETPVGAGSVAAHVDSAAFLSDLADYGVRVTSFVGRT
jgi:saccharopine dehydrogenase-like NADP-dependent oxidoreductase